MRAPRWWPWPRHRHPDLEVAEEKVAQAASDRRAAEIEREEARRLAAWAREATLSNKFDLRLHAAWRTREPPP